MNSQLVGIECSMCLGFNLFIKDRDCCLKSVNDTSLVNIFFFKGKLISDIFLHLKYLQIATDSVAMHFLRPTF